VSKLRTGRTEHKIGYKRKGRVDFLFNGEARSMLDDCRQQASTAEVCGADSPLDGKGVLMKNTKDHLKACGHFKEKCE
jgi:hypothetical protein